VSNVQPVPVTAVHPFTQIDIAAMKSLFPESVKLTPAHAVQALLSF
jgi:hypothetical protein